MLAKDLISKKISTLKTSDTGETALELMNELKISHLPVLNKRKLLGVISEKDILEAADNKEQVSNYKQSLFSPFIFGHQHFFDAIEVATRLHLSIVPVLNDKEEYMGCITIPTLLGKAADVLNTNGPGGVIVLKTHDHDYVLSEIARLLENENTKILSFTTNLQPDGFLLITLKVNTDNITGALKCLERFNYEIYSYFLNEDDESDAFQKRLNEFLHYMNI